MVVGMRWHLLHLGHSSWAWSQDVHVSVRQASPPWKLLVTLSILASSHFSAPLKESNGRPQCRRRMVRVREAATIAIRSLAQVLAFSLLGRVHSSWADQHHDPPLPECGQAGGWKGSWNPSGWTILCFFIKYSYIVPYLWLLLLWQHFSCKSLKYIPAVSSPIPRESWNWAMKAVPFLPLHSNCS